MRFRKSIRLAPGVRINLSRSGVTTTFGGRGASVNVGKGGTRATMGIRGTGLSFSRRLADGEGGASNDGAAQAGGCSGLGCLGFLMLVLMGRCLDTDRPSSSPGLVTPPPYSAPVTTETREWFYVHGALNVRAAPDKDAAIVQTLRRGDYVQLGPKDTNGWARLYSVGSAEGYVYRASDLVQRRAPAAPTTPRSAYSSGGRLAPFQR